MSLRASGPLRYDGDHLTVDGVALADIADREGTPCYVYSAATILDRFHAYHDSFGALPHTICYAVKANSNLSILRLLAEAGSGFDIVSGGELFRVLAAGGDPGKTVFSGVGKTAEEIEYALESGIHSFNCESEAELALIDSLAARRGRRATVALRVNPDVDARTHPYISTGLRENKFGIAIDEVEEVYRRALERPNLAVEGVSCHIGSQLLDTQPVMEAVERVLELVDRLRAVGVSVRHLDLGGGLGVPYEPSHAAPDIGAFVRALARAVAASELHVMVEPGRSLVAEAGVLLTRVLYRKKTPQKEFVVVDAAMNDLIRPSLYNSYHEIVPVRRNPWPPVVADIVGPVCESGDFLAQNRPVANVFPGDLLAVCTAGAYGMVLASNYNSRPRPAEILIQHSAWRVIRARESYQDLIRGE